MKKFLLRACLLLTLLCGALGVTACEKEHVHDWGEWVSDGQGGHTRVCKLDDSHVESGKCEDHFVHSTTSATCTEKGFTTYGCTACGYTYQEETKALDHDYVYTFDEVTKQHVGVCSRDENHVVREKCTFDEGMILAPTCVDEGYTLYTCTVCEGTFRDDFVNKLGHSWADWHPVSDTKIHMRECTRTGCNQKEDGECTFSTFLKHADPTCTERGYDLYECPDCHGTICKNEVATGGHSWGQWTFNEAQKKHYHECFNCSEREEFDCETGAGTETKPTCETDGYTTYICPVCRGSYKTFDEKTQKAVGHIYSDLWRKEESAPGSHYRLCKICQHRETESCTYTVTNTAPDCLHMGKATYTCKDCSYSYTTETEEKGTHRFGEWKPSGDKLHHKQICEVCKEEVEAQCVYTPVTQNADCTNPGKTIYTCDTCQNKYEVAIPKLDHAYPAEWTHLEGSNPSKHFRICSRCGGKEERECVLKTIESLPTCSNPDGVHTLCEECLFLEDSDLANGIQHQWSGWKHEIRMENGAEVHFHIRTCMREGCDAKLEDGTPYSEEQKCVFDQETVNSTCLNAGTTTFTCRICSHEYTAITGEALGHDYGPFEHIGGTQNHQKMCRRENCDGIQDQIIIEPCSYEEGARVDPTCLTGGYTVFTCKTCGDTEHRSETAALGHEYTGPWISGKDGTHYRICQRDDRHRDTQSCTFEDGPVTSPTCTEKGFTLQTCKECRFEQKVNETNAIGHDWVLAQERTVTTDNHMHTMRCNRCQLRENQNCTYNTQSTPATCAAPEHHIHTCTVCKYVYEHDEGLALGHSWGQYEFNITNKTHCRTCTRSGCGQTEEGTCSGIVIASHEATCKTFGYKEYQCSICNGIYIGDQTQTYADHKWGLGWASSLDGSTHYRTCTICLASDSRSCVMEVEKQVDPTCTSNGYLIKVCKTCTRRISENFKKLGHNFGSDINNWKPDPERPGEHFLKCTRCDYRENGTCTMLDLSQAPTCNFAGKKGKICSVCSYSVGVEDIEQLTHVWSELTPTKDGKHFKYCLRNCGAREEEECQFTVISSDEATCTQAAGIIKDCEKCHYHVEEITAPALGHHWVKSSSDETNHNARCDRIGCGETATGNHVFKESNLCEYCQYDGLTYAFGDEEKTFYLVENDSRVANVKHLIIPDVYQGKPVKKIRQFAVQNNEAVETITIADSIEEIEMYAFAGCNHLSNVEFTQTEKAALRTIGMRAFGSCFALNSISLPQTVTFIGEEAFYRCRALNQIDLPENVRIENNAFTETGMYNDPANWTKENAFYLCNHLFKVSTGFQGNFEIEEGTVTVGAGAFQDCKGLTSVKIPSSVKDFDKDAFLGCVNLKEVTYPGDLHAWLSITFENDYSSPLHYASSLAISGAHGEIDFIPESVKEIPAGTFRGTEITSIRIPEGVTSIGAGAFENCANLSSITIPDTVAYIGKDAFKGTAFYQNPQNWKNGLLYIGHHLVAAKDDEIGAYNNGAVQIESNTVTISPYVFYQFEKIKSVNIPKSVVWIGEEAFTGSSLKSAEFEGEDTVFFAFNLGGAGRWLSSDDLNGSRGATFLIYYYPREWKRIK